MALKPRWQIRKSSCKASFSPLLIRIGRWSRCDIDSSPRSKSTQVAPSFSSTVTFLCLNHSFLLILQYSSFLSFFKMPVIKIKGKDIILLSLCLISLQNKSIAETSHSKCRAFILLKIESLRWRKSL